MTTEPVYACHVEIGDHIVTSEQEDGDLVGIVTDLYDEGNFIMVVYKDEDGDTTEVPVGPFDTIHIVTSFEEE